MRFTHTIPFYSVLSTLGLFAVSPAYSSIVRSDVDYQYFRDFAENKGAFAVDASNISIQDKQGKILGRVLSGIPMPDFRVSNRQTAIATLVHPQYVNSVKHNVGYGSIQFGNDTQNPEEQAYTYRLVSRNPHPDYDYHLPRLNKLVTEISPAALSSVPLLGNGQPKANAYLDTDRFPYFVRLGSGTQQVRKADGTRTRTAPAYQYLTGGTPLKVLGFQNHGLLVGGSLTDQPLNTYAIAGDSGSPLFAFDKHENRWVLTGVLSTYAGFDNFFNKYIVTQPEFIRSTIRQYETRLDVGLTTNELIWRDNGNGNSTLQGLNERITLPIANPSLAPQNDSRHMPSEDAGKTLILSSRFDNKTLMLADNINQGAGALQFDSNFTVVGKNHTWQGAGVIVADGKRVFWQVSNPKGDRLSKLGAGTLIANGQGINQGDISIGEGTVVLAQKAASDGSKQAFNQVGITSGRGTAVLADSQQIKPENLYFGFRGGRLDLNGNNLAFTHIRHADGGAQIVNHNPDQAATLTLDGAQITLNPDFANNTHNNRFNTLTVNGTLDGFGTFRFLTGIVRKQNAPPLKLEGDSRGAFQIHVKNTGQEPQTTESLALVSLNPKHSHQARFTLQNGYADLGAYRYILRKNNNGYSLYNPLKEAELQIEATRAEHERNQQAYNQLQATDISRQVQHDSDATRQALQAWQNSQTELARIDSQVQYLSAQLKQTDPLTGILTRAQNLCAAQGYSADICRQVAKAADTNDLTLFETELDTYIERVEMAESELDKARQGGDAQAVETARHAYLNALNRLSRQIHSLKTGVAGIRMPNLAELISRSANTAVSEQAAYNTGRQQAGRRIDRHLTDPQQQNIWLETGTQQTDYHSGTHRPYQQTTNYAHIGIQTGITDRLSVGTILTDERTNNRFDEGVSARNRSNGAHLFVKGENGALFAAADLGYSNSRTRFTDYDGAAVRRHAWDAGINTGIKIDTGINLRPYAGIRINRSNGNRYVLDGAEINSPAQIQTTWHAGIRLDKTVELGQAKLTPAFSSDYYHTRQNSGSALSVNDRTLLQQAAHGTLHTLQIDAGYKGWNAKLHAAYGKDSNTARHKQAGIKIGYNW
ncbi:immunoglobulin A1 protease family protein [Neisseria meningitidis 2002020]|uniref:S6 family peptidase n=1 Tax=Neisseria meningitidis TaxID=487 RepID=UPI00032FF0D6|nr:S6 family peptidase [Neisseria meningitidis]EOC15326.1 immunoglobulin A1 protease family protein [Neisseria meningitidis 2002020]